MSWITTVGDPYESFEFRDFIAYRRKKGLNLRATPGWNRNHWINAKCGDCGKWSTPYCTADGIPLTVQCIHCLSAHNPVLAAWGETKCWKAWMDDPRREVPSNQVMRRLRQGWSAQDALSVPRLFPAQRSYENVGHYVRDRQREITRRRLKTEQEQNAN